MTSPIVVTVANADFFIQGEDSSIVMKQIPHVGLVRENKYRITYTYGGITQTVERFAMHGADGDNFGDENVITLGNAGEFAIFLGDPYNGIGGFVLILENAAIAALEDFDLVHGDKSFAMAYLFSELDSDLIIESIEPVECAPLFTLTEENYDADKGVYLACNNNVINGFEDGDKVKIIISTTDDMKSTTSEIENIEGALATDQISLFMWDLGDCYMGLYLNRQPEENSENLIAGSCCFVSLSESKTMPEYIRVLAIEKYVES